MAKEYQNKKLAKAIDEFNTINPIEYYGKKRTKFSASKLEHYNSCPGSFWWPRLNIDSTINAQIEGSKIHDRIHEFLYNYIIDRDLGKNDPIEFERFLLDNPLYSGYLRHALDIVINQSEGIVAIESYYEITDKDHSLFGLSGRTDFGFYNCDSIYVTELKTGKRIINPENNLQLMAYAILMHEVSFPKEILLSPFLRQIKINTIHHSVFQHNVGREFVTLFDKNAIISKIANVKFKILNAHNNPTANLAKGKCVPWCDASHIHLAT